MTSADGESPGQPERAPGEQRIAAVVLAGGAARRFGSDKLTAAIDGAPLLDRAIGTLPTHWPVIMVGPERQLSDAVLTGRTISTVREPRPGSGPAAALITGIVAALDPEGTVRADIVVTLPGDAPAGGTAARTLVAALLDASLDPPAQADDLRTQAVVGMDTDGIEQPLQFAARASALSNLVARTDTDGLPARRLLADLGSYRRVALSAELTADVDTPEDLARWRR